MLMLALLLLVQAAVASVVDCEGSYGACSAACKKAYAHDIEASGGGVECDIAVGHEEDCLASADECVVPVDCVGAYGACSADGKKVYSIDTPASDGGAACAAAADDEAACVNCVGAYGTCSEACKKVYAVATAASDGGVECEAADAAEADCLESVDLCVIPDVDCVGAFGSCSVDCKKVYAISTAKSGGGAACDNAAGDEGTCVESADLCVIEAVACVGAYGKCTKECKKTYAVSVAASGGGAACSAADGDVGVCSVSADLCEIDESSAKTVSAFVAIFVAVAAMFM